MITKSRNMALAGVIITASMALLISSTTVITGTHFVNQVAFAQGGSGQPTPALNQNVVWQGSVSSSASKLPGHENEHTAVILGPRNDRGVYSGILTYQASKPVNVIVWNFVRLDNKTAIPKEFGSQNDMIKLGKDTVALTTLGSSGKSGSVPFTGNAIELVNTGGGKNKDFTATYSVNVVGTQGKMVNDLKSLSTFNATNAG